jgi:hypothetical protein
MQRLPLNIGKFDELAPRVPWPRGSARVFAQDQTRLRANGDRDIVLQEVRALVQALGLPFEPKEIDRIIIETIESCREQT